MFSYRHAFHAGNHADVLKHLILVQLLDYFKRKDKGFSYIDTHAGAGAYVLDEGFAARSGEAASGIARLWSMSREGMPPLLADYLDAIARLNADGTLRYYPGSPYLAWHAAREQDRLRLFELHSTEIEILRANFSDADRQVSIEARDGFDGLRAVVPPPTRRAVVLIDPSYEDKHDYQRVLESLRDAHRRFATGTYALWYPRVARVESRRFPAQLEQFLPEGWLHASLDVSAPPADGRGLSGSGMYIVNPPYLLASALRDTLPWLVQTLGQDSAASFTLVDRGV